MLYIAKIGGYLKILNDDKVKDFVVISFSEYLYLWEKNDILN